MLLYPLLSRTCISDFFTMNDIKSWGPTWAVVSGASRGFGASICEVLAEKLDDKSLILGIARSKEGLESTCKKVKKINPNIQVRNNYENFKRNSGSKIRYSFYLKFKMIILVQVV